MASTAEKFANEKLNVETKLENVNSLLEKVCEEKRQLESNFNKVLDEEN
jgi:hypothetical protein